VIGTTFTHSNSFRSTSSQGLDTRHASHATSNSFAHHAIEWSGTSHTRYTYLHTYTYTYAHTSHATSGLAYGLAYEHHHITLTTQAFHIFATGLARSWPLVPALAKAVPHTATTIVTLPFRLRSTELCYNPARAPTYALHSLSRLSC